MKFLALKILKSFVTKICQFLSWKRFFIYSISGLKFLTGRVIALLKLISGLNYVDANVANTSSSAFLNIFFQLKEFVTYCFSYV